MKENGGRRGEEFKRHFLRTVGGKGKGDGKGKRDRDGDGEGWRWGMEDREGEE